MTRAPVDSARDDLNKCAHRRLGMASSCSYRVTGAGTIAEHHYWVCSDACKAERPAKDVSAAGAEEE